MCFVLILEDSSIVTHSYGGHVNYFRLEVFDSTIFLLFCYRVLTGFDLPTISIQEYFLPFLTFKQLWTLLFLDFFFLNFCAPPLCLLSFGVQNTLELRFSLFGSQSPDNITHEIVYNHTHFWVEKYNAFVTANKHNNLTCGDYKQTADTLHYTPNRTKLWQESKCIYRKERKEKWTFYFISPLVLNSSRWGFHQKTVLLWQNLKIENCKKQKIKAFTIFCNLNIT